MLFFSSHLLSPLSIHQAFTFIFFFFHFPLCLMQFTLPLSSHFLSLSLLPFRLLLHLFSSHFLSLLMFDHPFFPFTPPFLVSSLIVPTLFPARFLFLPCYSLTFLSLCVIPSFTVSCLPFLFPSPTFTHFLVSISTFWFSSYLPACFLSLFLSLLFFKILLLIGFLFLLSSLHL